MAAKRSARQCNSVKPLSQQVFETLSRRIHDANVLIAKWPGLSDVEALANFWQQSRRRRRRESESIERRYSALPRKWYRIVTS